MKNIFLVLFFIITLNLYANERVTFTSDPSPPYVIGKFGDIPFGLSVNIVNEIFSQIENVEANYTPLVPWKRVLNSVEYGKIDAIFPILKNKEREKKYFYSDAIIPAETSMFYLKKNFPNGLKWNTLKDLDNKTICVVNGYSVHKYLKKQQKEKNYQYKIITVSGSAQSCLRLLKRSRVDIYATNKSIGLFQLNEFNLDKTLIGIADKPIYIKSYYMAFSKKTNAHKLIPKINQAIKKIKEERTIDKILYGK